MNKSRTNNGASPEYIACFKLYVQADGGLLVTMGNTRMLLSPDEVHALLCGTLDYARVFTALHQQVTDTTRDIVADSESRVNGLAV